MNSILFKLTVIGFVGGMKIPLYDSDERGDIKGFNSVMDYLGLEKISIIGYV
jgi:hypothetical protein